MKSRSMFAGLWFAALLPGAAMADDYYVSGENVESASIVTHSPMPQQYYQGYRPYPGSYANPHVGVSGAYGGSRSSVTVVYQTPTVIVPTPVPQVPTTVYYVEQPTRYYPFGGHPQARFNQPPTRIEVIRYESRHENRFNHHHNHRR